MSLSIREGNPDIRVTFDATKCIHARECILSLPNVFVWGTQGEWIFPENGSSEDLVSTIRRCPSGALQYERLDWIGSIKEPSPETNVIQVRENGPLALRAKIVNLREKFSTYRSTLCRCGQSKNKPFCDGSHKAIEFLSTGEPISVVSSPEIVKSPDDLSVFALQNWPYQIKGNHQIVTGTNAKITTQIVTHLCRCGQSKNKPFCDGTHVTTGFQADSIDTL